MLMQALLRMLPAYYNHFRAFENALVTKFYGLHCVKLTGAAQKKVQKLIGLYIRKYDRFIRDCAESFVTSITALKT